MEEKQYLIGEFAAMNRVSARMLRHYDKIGLLKPISMKENGYRCYGERQIAAISEIKKLRDCDFSLDEISQIFANHSDTFFMEQVKRKMSDLNRQSILHQRAAALLERFSEAGFQDDFVSQYGISLTSREESTLLVSKQAFDSEYIETGFERLFAFLPKKHLTTNGCAVLLSCFDENTEDKNQVGVPVTKPYEDEQYITIVLPKATCLSTIHYGDYYSIGHAYSSIMSYAELNCYSVGPCFAERYLIDSSHTAGPAQYVTEIVTVIKNFSLC